MGLVCRPVMPTLWEAEGGRLQIGAQPRQLSDLEDSVLE